MSHLRSEDQGLDLGRRDAISESPPEEVVDGRAGGS
jgi:hypothetical protein